MDSILGIIDTIFSADTLLKINDYLQLNDKIMEELNSNHSTNYVQLVSVISGAIAALAALVAIYLTFISQKTEREYKRPYFVIEAPGFKPLDKAIRLQITFINNGVNPAKDFNGEIRIFQMDLKNEIKIDIDVVNDIPQNSPTPYYYDNVILGSNMPKHYIYCNISYLDPISKKTYKQEFFMKWDGVLNGYTYPDFVHVNKTDKEIIEKYIKN